jgi:hypothetical protein
MCVLRRFEALVTTCTRAGLDCLLDLCTTRVWWACLTMLDMLWQFDVCNMWSPFEVGKRCTLDLKT